MLTPEFYERNMKRKDKEFHTDSWLFGRNGFGTNISKDDVGVCWIGIGGIGGFCGDGVRLWSVVAADTTVCELSSSTSDKRIEIW